MEKKPMFDRNKQYALCPFHEVTRIINGKVYIITRHFVGNKNVGDVIINLIIVKDLSRFGRNYIQVGQYIDYIFPTYNIRFIALNDNVDTLNGNSTAMDMMPIMNVFNEWHAANTSKKIRAVIEAN